MILIKINVRTITRNTYGIERKKCFQQLIKKENGLAYLMTIIIIVKTRQRPTTIIINSSRMVYFYTRVYIRGFV